MYVNALSDVGLIRKDNEDNYLVSAERGLFVVADGMGGHVGGQIASSIAIQIIDQEIKLSLLEENTPELLNKALIKANEKIYKQGQEEEFFGMGTTVTAALFRNDDLYISHIGDSRAYLYREGKLTLLTDDHSLVYEMYQQGSLTLEEARNHPQRNILTRALGTQDIPGIDKIAYSVQAGDILLLCTDGLYSHVRNDEITKVLDKDVSLKVQVREMVDLALERGGTDNITAVLVQYE